MFKVQNADFIADKLAAELLPDQEFREAAKNAEEAIRRRLAGEAGSTSGRIEFDVDWALKENQRESRSWYLCCADNGDGMTKFELERYTTTLAVQGANKNQSLTGNQGMGLKISGPTRHKRGILIRSMKNGERSMVQVGWTGTEYDLIPLDGGRLITTVPEEYFPKFIRDQGSGTVVTFLGNDEPENTFSPNGRPKTWLLKYLNMRFASPSMDAVELFVRVPSGREDEWPRTAVQADERQRGKGKSFNRTRVGGTTSIWSEAADRLGPGSRGVVGLPGLSQQQIPSARMHWWIIPNEEGTDVTSRTSGGGSLAVLYQGELHDWRRNGTANPMFARLGVLYGKTRIGFVLEPLGDLITSDFARAHVLVGGRPLFESEAWLVWSDQFRERMPTALQDVMAEERDKLQAGDPDRSKRIRDRLRDIMRLLRPRRFRANPAAKEMATGPELSGPDGGGEGMRSRTSGSGHRRPGQNKMGIGAVLSQVTEEDGVPANEIFMSIELETRWTTEREAADFPFVSDDNNGLADRAAGLVGEDGLKAGLLLLNRDFRGFRTMVAALNDWANPEGDPSKTEIIDVYTREWIEQKLVEAIQGLRQLENDTTWIGSAYNAALSPSGLTAAFMADRYHTIQAVKRDLGGIRSDKRAAS